MFARIVRALRVDCSRALGGRWFAAAVLATLCSLWLSVGRELASLPDMLEYTGDPDWAGLLVRAMQGQFAALSLPALSALPAAGLALVEIQTGAARAAVFRSAWRGYVLGKTACVLVSGMAVQALALLLLTLIAQGIRLHALGQGIPASLLKEALSPAAGRMLCGGIWAGMGSLVALLSQTASAATVGPLCLCYALVMVGTRFFPDTTAINPLTWLRAASPFLWAGLAACGMALAAVHAREVRQHV